METYTHCPCSEALLDTIRARLPEFLGEKRLNHTFFVEKESLALAESVFLVYNIANVYTRDLRAAALLHDLTKEMPLDKQLALCERFGIECGKSPSAAVLHGHTAAYLARELFGISEPVFSAVYYHTTGKANMNIFEKIIFLADYIEPSRRHEHCQKTRAFFYGELARRGAKDSAAVLDQAILMSLDGTLSHLLDKGCVIDLQTVEARNYLIGQTA